MKDTCRRHALKNVNLRNTFSSLVTTLHKITTSLLQVHAQNGSIWKLVTKTFAFNVASRWQKLTEHTEYELGISLSTQEHVRLPPWTQGSLYFIREMWWRFICLKSWFAIKNCKILSCSREISELYAFIFFFIFLQCHPRMKIWIKRDSWTILFYVTNVQKFFKM